MKKTLTEILDEATVEELDLLLDGLEFDSLEADTLERIRAAVRVKLPPPAPAKRDRKSVV